MIAEEILRRLLAEADFSVFKVLASGPNWINLDYSAISITQEEYDYLKTLEQK